jgi:hypothetical protein
MSRSNDLILKRIPSRDASPQPTRPSVSVILTKSHYRVVNFKVYSEYTVDRVLTLGNTRKYSIFAIGAIFELAATGKLD